MSHRKSSTLSINVSRNKPLPPIVPDELPQEVTSPVIQPLRLSNPTSTPNGIFQPKTLKRRNLKKLTLSEDAPPGPSSSSLPPTGPLALGSPNNQTLSIPTPKSTTSSKNEDLELLENFEKLTITINNQYNLKQSDLLTLKTLGEGQSGVVTKSLHIPTNKTMAKKQILFEKNFKVQNQILRELKILNDVKNPYIIEFYGAIFIDSAGGGEDQSQPSSAKEKDIPKESNEVSGIRSNGVLICMEYMDCRSLDHILKKLGFLKEVYSSKITFAILQGLNYLYAKHKIIHRDIKPSNVLLNSKGEVKICDFGVSRELNNNSIADTFVGTSTYMSPERIQGDVYSIKGDVWSLGLMLIELSTGEFPFGKKDTPNGILDLLQRIVNEEPPSLPRDKYSKELCDFVDLCLKKQMDRPTPLDLLNMKKSFITKYEAEDSRQLLRHLAKKLKKPKK